MFFRFFTVSPEVFSNADRRPENELPRRQRGYRKAKPMTPPETICDLPRSNCISGPPEAKSFRRRFPTPKDGKRSFGGPPEMRDRWTATKAIPLIHRTFFRFKANPKGGV